MLGFSHPGRLHHLQGLHILCVVQYQISPAYTLRAVVVLSAQREGSRAVQSKRAPHLRRGGSDTLVRKCHCLFIVLPPPPPLYSSLIHFGEGREGREAFMGILNKSTTEVMDAMEGRKIQQASLFFSKPHMS